MCAGRDGGSIAQWLDHQSRPACRFGSQAPECRGEGVTAMSRATMKSSHAAMKSLILKRSIMIAGQKTSVSLEDEFWQALKQIAAGLDMPVAELVHQIGRQREYGNLSSALRLFVLEHYLSRAKVNRTSEAAQEAPQESAQGPAQGPAQGKVCPPT
jgi:predicted DNA-binding ribbon-helix-helix protein